MTEPRPTPAELERRLADCRRDYDQLKARVADIGFICEGSLVERYTSCGNPNCRCADPDQRHGPYYQLSWKQGGRTASRRLSAEHARLYREWIANRRQLEALLTDMRAVSRTAGQYLLDAATEPAPGADQPRRRRPSGDHTDA
ncbi:MAG TPA: DUF6788 family protein [Candidatus Limnocylindrales bacterium]|nr:DUF6788 family protein [Candidatus Limnocylindrales bacterium]